MITGFIPARAGSKGVPGKNMALLAGQPLYHHALAAGRAAGIGRFVISTDMPGILNARQGADVTLHRRAAALAGDTVPMIDVVLSFLDGWQGAGVIVLLQPTSPLRRPEQIRAALELYASGRFDMVMSAVEIDRSVLKAGLRDGDYYRPVNDPAFVFSNRQALPPVLRHNGAIYVFDADWLRQNRSFESDRIGVTLMDAESSVDVDKPEDLARCADILATRGDP